MSPLTRTRRGSIAVQLVPVDPAPPLLALRLAGQEHALECNRDYVLGSAADCDLRLPPAAAPHHALLVVTPDGIDQMVAAKPVARVVDTTAAGDSFAAAYLASRLRGTGPVAAAEAGHTLAGVVVGSPGAIIPRSAMPAALTKDTVGRT